MERRKSKVHDATVHVFSYSVLCCGGVVMSEALRKFINKWTGNRKYSSETSSKGMISKFFGCTFHVNPGATLMHILAVFEEHIASASDFIRKHCAPETHPHSVFMGMMNEKEVFFRIRSSQRRSTHLKRHSWSRPRWSIQIG